MRISEAAKAAGVGVETIRFYEQKGLIAQPARPADGGMRAYDRETVDRVRFVRQAQEIGFSLREVAELLSLRADPGAGCADVRNRAIEKRDEVQARLDRLSAIRDALDELIARCPGGGDITACSILDAMDRGAAATDAAPVRPHAKPAEGTQTMKTTTLNIDGMHCDGCALTIETLLSRVAGVRNVEASFDERQARILHDPARASETDLVAVIARGGFRVASEPE